MRDFHERQENALIQSEWLLVMMITTAVVTTIVFTVTATFVTVLLSTLYLSLLVGTHMPNDYFWQAFFGRVWLFGAGTAVVVIATTIHRCWQLSTGGGRTIARARGSSAQPGPRLFPCQEVPGIGADLSGTDRAQAGPCHRPAGPRSPPQLPS